MNETETTWTRINTLLTTSNAIHKVLFQYDMVEKGTERKGGQGSDDMSEFESINSDSQFWLMIAVCN